MQKLVGFKFRNLKYKYRYVEEAETIKKIKQ